MRLCRGTITLAFMLAQRLASAAPGSAQQSAPVPPIRQLGPRLAASKDSLGNVVGVRQLRDGRVMVNDVGKHRLLLYDSALTHAAVIADQTEATKKAYGSGPGGILAYRGDTTMFVDPIALSMLVIDPHGDIVRTVAPPRPSDAPALALPIGNAAFDAAGRVLYRGVKVLCMMGNCMVPMGQAPPEATPQAASSLPAYMLHDSSAIIRGDVATHVIDTVGFIGFPYTNRRLASTSNPDGSMTVTWGVTSPIPIVDDWAVVSDGSVAIVRGLDYHIDWVNADGTRSSTPKIAHDWHRLSDSEKTAIIDSARRSLDSTMQASAAVRARADSISKANGRPVMPAQKTIFVWPEPSDLPDYRPVLTQNAMTQTFAVKADVENNLWIRQGGPGTLLPGSGAAAVYDVVNRQGRLIDRVQLPPTLSLAGFGPGVVYLTSREGWGTVVLKYRIR